MPSLGELIRARRRELGFTLERVAGAAECTRSYLSQIENDRRTKPPSQKLLAKLEWALRLDRGALTTLGQWEATPGAVKREVEALRAQGELARRLAGLVRDGGLDEAYRSGELRRLVNRFGPPENGSSAEQGAPGGDRMELVDLLPRRVPLVNKVSAGYPTEFTDLGYPARVADEYVYVPGVDDDDAFAARVCGDSMAPQYAEGDIVVFSPAAPTSEGSDCFARFVRDDETTFKRVYFERSDAGGQLIRLQPLNSAYPPRTVPREAIAGLYRAVYVVRSV